MRRAASSVALAALAASLLVVASAGCPKKPDDRPNMAENDSDSGDDSTRAGAHAIPVNRPAPPDEVGYDQGDTTDWKVVQLRGKAGIFTVELRWDNDKADLYLDIFDEQGNQIATSPGRDPGKARKMLSAQIPQPGGYYIRVQAPGPHNGSIYTVMAKWDGPVAEPAAQQVHQTAKQLPSTATQIPQK
jgi:hypothetical protein